MSADQIVNSELDRLIKDHQGIGLWFLDEHEYAPPLHQPSGLMLITNRFDVYQRFAQAGWTIQFSDWDISALAVHSFDVVYYRISKEKAIVNWLIKAAQRLLKPEGELRLIGAKAEGLKGYFDRLKPRSNSSHLDKLGKGAMAALLTGLNDEIQTTVDDNDYAKIRPIVDISTLPIVSKPGVFGWQKVDIGSEFLADSWHQFEWLFDNLSTGKTESNTVLDLGCGYGYISLRYWDSLNAEQRKTTTLTATDSNAAAIACCQQNFNQWNVQGNVIPANCADAIEGCFDLILCNPPFHQGFGIEGELTDRFLETTNRLLDDKGQAFFVVNAFVPLAKKAASRFATVDEFADNGSFKLYRLAKPIR